jgi:membrane protein YdbS with pleckstrin-like domain
MLAERQARLDAEHQKMMRQRLSSRVVQMGPQTTNRGFFGLLMLIVALGTLVAVVLPAWVTRVFVALLVVLVLGALFVPAIRYPLSRWLDRTF